MHPFQSGARFHPTDTSESTQVWSPPPRSSNFQQEQQHGNSGATSLALSVQGSPQGNGALAPLSKEASELVTGQSEAAALASKEWARRDRSKVADGEWLLIGIPTVALVCEWSNWCARARARERDREVEMNRKIERGN